MPEKRENGSVHRRRKAALDDVLLDEKIVIYR